MVTSLAIRGIDESVKYLVDELSVLQDARAQDAFAREAGFFQHAHGSRIPLEHWGFEPHEVEARQDRGRHALNCRGHDAAAPEGLAQPIAEMRRLGVHAFAEDAADGADRCAFDLD